MNKSTNRSSFEQVSIENQSQAMEQLASGSEQVSSVEQPMSMVNRVREAQQQHRLNVTRILDHAELAQHVGSYDTAINALHTVRVNADEATLWDETSFNAFKADMEHEIAILEQNVHVWKQDLVSKEDSSNANDTTNPQADEPIDQTSNNKEPEQRDQGPTMMSRVREAEKAHLELMSMILDDDLCQRYYDEIHKHIRVLTTIRPLNAAHSANWTETDFQKFRKSYSEEAMSMKNYMDILRLRKEREDFEKELPQRLLARMMADLELSPIRKTHKDHTIDEDEDVDEDEDENEDEEETEGESDRQVSISPPPSSAEDPNYSDPDNPYAAFQKTPTFIPPAYYKSQSQTKPKPTSLPVSQPNFTHPLPAKPPGPNPSTWETITMRQKRMTQRPQQINVFRAEAANETRKTATVVFGRDSWRLKHAEPKSAGDAHQRFAAHQALWRKEKEVKPFGLRDWRTRPADNVKEAKPRTAGSESGVEWTLVKSRKSLRRESVDG